jgi:predicted lipoprotein with Yx(FWY)xxD motif
MHAKLVLGSGLLAVAFAAAACGAASPYATAPTAAPSIQPTTAPVVDSPSPVPSPHASGTVIRAASTRLGQALVDSKGRTVYLFLADSGSSSNCNSVSCVQYWPPVLTTAAPQAGSGVKASLLGSTKRKDGTIEVTYAGHPLYYFISDKKAGDVTGQAINAFGARWYIVSPSGMQIG